MRPLASTVDGLIVYVFGSTDVTYGLMRVPTPVCLSTLKTVPPAPGTYRNPPASAGWKTGSKKFEMVPMAFQSVAKSHTFTRLPFCHVYFVSDQFCVANDVVVKRPV